MHILDVVPSHRADIGDLALVQYFEWLLGEANTLALIPVAEMTGPRWKLFESVEHMNAYYEDRQSHRDKHLDKQAGVGG